MASNLLFNIAWTHVTTRVRQTLVGMAGVAMGVGFTIMMAGLMEGSQIDFLRQLVDTMPHITVQDERRDEFRRPIAAGVLGPAPVARCRHPARGGPRGVSVGAAHGRDGRARPGHPL